MKLKCSKSKKYLLYSLVFFAGAFIWPLATESKLFDTIAKIRQAINSGDSGYLIIASIINCLLFTIPVTFLYISLEFLSCHIRSKIEITDFFHNIFLIIGFMSIYLISSLWLPYFMEPMTTFVALIITLSLVYLAKHDQESMSPKIIISFQVFFYMQWFNIMPIFTSFHFGNSDIPISIKIASDYLENISVINSIGFSFILPLMISSIMTSLIFRMYVQNLKIVEENYQKAISLEAMQNKIMDNKVYQELNALAHDLKTPLSTIQGLSSLLAITKDMSKLENYTGRIDQAILKMTEMISSFLYGTSRQSLQINDLIKYIRAQIPVENELINFTTEIENNLPPVYVNKIRIARALVNLIENAILAPNSKQDKNINLKVLLYDKSIKIEISDDGMGISADDIERIWIIGYSSNNTTGLGLPFAKQTIDENDGSIDLKSIYGKGTTVTIILPTEDKKGGLPCQRKNLYES